jgi:RNA polymerase sigma factor (sigma-70 family)
MQYTDQQILYSIRSGEEEKPLAYLYKKVLPKIKNYIKSNSGDEEEAFDIFQDAMVIFYKQVKTDKFKEEFEIGGFLYSVCRNLWINRAKKKSRQVGMPEYGPDISSDSDVLDDLLTQEREELVMRMLSGLGERCKELLLLTIYYKYSMKEVCEKMGFSTENAAKTRNYKCKQKLVDLVKNDLSIKDLLR